MRMMTKLAVMAIATAWATLTLDADGRSNEHPNRVDSARGWTPKDIVTAPAIGGLTLSENGEWGFYISREADLRLNRKISSLHRVQLSSGKDEEILKSNWVESLQAIPKSSAWSVLADLGGGIQLYRIDSRLKVTPILVNGPPVTIGATDNAIGPPPAMEAPRRYGILSYRWSPDGIKLWYARARVLPYSAIPLIDDAVWWASEKRRREAPAVVEYRVKFENGEEILVDQRPTTDMTALENGGNASWNLDSTAVRYTVENHDLNEPAPYVGFVWKAATKTLRKLLDPPANPYVQKAIGPFGGRLQTSGLGEDRELEELLPDGSKHTYQKVDFRISDARGSGSWLSPDGARSVSGIRHIDSHPRYGLVVLDRISKMRLIEAPGSLTKCAFNGALDTGICVQEGMASSPQLVRVDPVSGQISLVADLAARHTAIKPLKVDHREWINRDGYSVTGFIVYPRNFVPGQRYPALVVTHGGDADERFANQEFQWDYPVQVFAERGYVVLCINDPSWFQYQQIQLATDEWSKPAGTLSSLRLQELLWLTGVHSFEDAIGELSAQGLVDSSRVGIAGFSRGAQMADVTMTQSTMFTAASSGDGGYLGPTAYYSPHIQVSYKRVFGGSPYDPVAQEGYRRLSPTFRASKAAGPILQQVATAHKSFIEFYQELRAANVPAQITLYPGEEPMSDETHLFHIPSNRLAAMEENLDWFDFWLRNMEDPAPEKAGQYKRWREMRKSRCTSLKDTSLPTYCRSQEQTN